MLDATVESRILTALNHEEGDRVPIWDYIDNHSVVEAIAPGETNLDKAMVKVYHTLGIDLCRGWGSAFSPEQDGITGEKGEWQIAGQSYWSTKKPIASIEDLKQYQPPRVDQAWLNDVFVPFHRARKEMLEPNTMWVPGAGCGFHECYGLMGQQLFSYAIYDAPGELERIMETLSDNCAAITEALTDAQLCPMFFIGDDFAYKGKLLFSPKYLRKTFIPMLKRCCEIVHDKGQKVIFHSDGYVNDILDDMLDAGIDGLNPIEPLAGMDIGDIKKRYGRNLVLVGNVDCSVTLPLGSVEDVIRATKDCIKAASVGGGHFIGSSSEITPSTPVENIFAFYDTCREFGRYPILG